MLAVHHSAERGCPAMTNKHLYRDFILAVSASVVANIITHVLMGL